MWIMENYVDRASNKDVESGTAHFEATKRTVRTPSLPHRKENKNSDLD